MPLIISISIISSQSHGIHNRYADVTPTSEVTPVTIWYIHSPHHGKKVNILVTNGLVGDKTSMFCSDWMSGSYHSPGLGSRSQRGHPVHFPRLIYSISQICKAQRFWRERQKSLRRGCRRGGRGGSGGGGENRNWTHKLTPDRGDSIIIGALSSKMVQLISCWS